MTKPRIILVTVAIALVVLVVYMLSSRPTNQRKAALKAEPAEKGHSLNGVVLNAQDQPVAGACVMIEEGMAHEGVSRVQYADDAGRFSITGLMQEQTFSLSIQAKGYAPTLVRGIASADAPEVRVRLETGKSLRVRVVDSAGQPIPGVTVNPVRWRQLTVGNRLSVLRFEDEWTFMQGDEVADARTDNNGQIGWDSAPADAVTLWLKKDGFMEQTIPLAAKDTEQVIVLNTILQVTGRVVDAESGMPLSAFRVISGVGEATDAADSWKHEFPIAGKDGLFQYTLASHAKVRFVRIEANGHPPLFQTFSDDQARDGVIPLSLQVDRRRARTVQIIDHAGTPVPDAPLYVITTAKPFWLEQSALFFPKESLYRVEHMLLHADREGRVVLDAQTTRARLVVVAPEGYADVDASDLASMKEIKLQRWSRVEGTCTTGTNLAPSILEYFYGHETKSNVPKVCGRITAIADATGKFVMERVPPVEGWIGRQVSTDSDVIAERSVNAPRKVTPAAGQTTSVAIGSGASVSGKINLRPLSLQGKLFGCALGEIEVEPPSLLTANEQKTVEAMSDAEKKAFLHELEKSGRLAAFRELYRTWKAKHPMRSTYVFGVRRDGQFEAFDLPEGKYVLTVRVFDLNTHETLGLATQSFTIDPVTANAPVNRVLGEIPVTAVSRESAR